MKIVRSLLVLVANIVHLVDQMDKLVGLQCIAAMVFCLKSTFCVLRKGASRCFSSIGFT